MLVNNLLRTNTNTPTTVSDFWYKKSKIICTGNFMFMVLKKYGIKLVSKIQSNYRY